MAKGKGKRKTRTLTMASRPAKAPAEKKEKVLKLWVSFPTTPDFIEKVKAKAKEADVSKEKFCEDAITKAVG